MLRNGFAVGNGLRGTDQGWVAPVFLDAGTLVDDPYGAVIEDRETAWSSNSAIGLLDREEEKSG